MNPEELSKKSPLEMDSGQTPIPQNLSEETPITPRETPIEKFTPPQQTTSNTLKSLRTYQGDVESIMGKQKTSIATIVMAEQKRKEEKRDIKKTIIEEERPEAIERDIPSGPSFITELKNKSFLTLGIGLVLLGCIGVGIAYYIQSREIILPEKETILSYSKDTSISLQNKTGQEILREIAEHKKSIDLHTNSIANIDILTATSTRANIHTLMSLIAPRIPGVLSRSLDEKYMFGLFSSDTTYPFIILTTSDYGSSWGGMLAWENGMVDDLRLLFNIQNDGYSRVFTDETIRNKDLRIVQDQSKKTVLVYSFLDKNTILITQNETVFTSILGKFIESKIVR